MEKDRYFRSSSFPLVTFLYVMGEKILEINEAENSSKKQFTFVATPRLNELADLYKFGDRGDPGLLVPIHLYEQARRELLDRLND